MSIVETTAGVENAGLDVWLPAFEGDRPGSVEVVETPLSWVFLTSRHAYKIKKPVDFGDVHHSSPARRRLACIDELWLNRRLAAGVYLGVVPLTRNGTSDVALGGRGVPVEWAVKMRRLPQDGNMFWLIHRGELSKSHVVALANLLAEFYCDCPPLTDVFDELAARLRRRVADERLLTAPFPPALQRVVRNVRAALSGYLDGAQSTLNARVCDGRIVDGHGDLRPEHVFFERRPAVIDCVEYSAARRKGDVLEDLSRLTMECLRLGRGDVAEAIVSAYRRRTHDDSFPELEAFYRSLHACGRAAAAIEAASGATADDACQPLAEATRYLKQAERDAALLT
jgi:aminoglycoside phosphotransferase family enzyme